MESYDDQQYDDLEAVPTLPEEDVSMSSSAIDVDDQEQPSRVSAFSRRKKVAVIIAVFAIAAIAIGVGLAAMPSGGTSAAQSTTNDEEVQEVGASQNENLDEAVVVVATTNDGASNSDETSSAVVDNASTPQDQQDTTIDNQDTETVPQDIIYDEGYEQTSETWSYSGPTILFDPDSLQEGIFVPPEEKVPLESDVLEALETVNFDGPLTNFIVGSPRISLSAYNGACTDPNEGEWFMQLTTDLYPWENRWAMISEDGEVIMSGPPEGRNYDRATTYIGTMCVPKGTYTMKLFDKGGDGICCSFGNGKMIVKVNDQKVLETGSSNFAEFSQDIEIVPANPDNNNTPEPTPKPTPKPTPIPVAPIQPSNLIAVTVKVRTDNFGGETGYKFVSLDTGEVLLNKQKGTLSSNQLYEDTLFVEPGRRFDFTVSDNYNGIEPNGYYSIEVDGEEIMYGGRFKDKTKSFIIRPGYTPTNMSNKDRLWLDEHNSRRRAFHVKNGGQGAYNRLLWSNELEASARAWAGVISPTCTLTREPDLSPGENIALRNVNPNQIAQGGEGPSTIVKRWVDQKIGQGYPGNKSATQALWRGTRYVGCHSSETDLPNGNKCYVSICRYAQAGNCDMSSVKETDADGNVKYDWTAAVMKDRSRCGPACPLNSSGVPVCY